jgi:succinate-acetate transporter protein
LRSPLLPWARLFGGLLLVLAGIWLVVAGPLFDRLWLDIFGAILLALGGYLVGIGVRSLRRAGH